MSIILITASGNTGPRGNVNEGVTPRSPKLQIQLQMLI